jgi:hypothetical protein
VPKAIWDEMRAAETLPCNLLLPRGQNVLGDFGPEDEYDREIARGCSKA